MFLHLLPHWLLPLSQIPSSEDFWLIFQKVQEAMHSSQICPKLFHCQWDCIWERQKQK